MPHEVCTALDRLRTSMTVSIAPGAEDVGPDVTVVVAGTPEPAALSRTVAERTVGRAAVLLFTGELDEPVAVEALRSGVTGYVVMSCDRPGAALLALHRVLRGESYISACVLDRLLVALRQVPGPSSAIGSAPALSAEEHQILLMLAAGMTNQRVGRRLSVSEGTVRNRLSGIYTKLQVERRSEAIAKFSRLYHGGTAPSDDQLWCGRILPTSGEPRPVPAPGSTQVGMRS